MFTNLVYFWAVREKELAQATIQYTGPICVHDFKFFLGYVT